MPTALDTPSKPAIVPCVWDKETTRYVPVHSPRGQIIFNTPVKVVEPSPVWKRPVPVEPVAPVDHVSGMKIPGDLAGQGRVGCCGVVAVSVAAGVPFKEAFRWMARKHKGNWKGSTTGAERMLALEHFGKKFEFFRIKSGEFQLHNVVRRMLKPDTLYMICTTHHVQTVRNGWVSDQQGPKEIMKYWGKRKHVTDILEIIN